MILKNNGLKLVALTLGLLVLLGACRKNTPDLLSNMESKIKLQKLIDSGNLLNEVTKVNGQYAFAFEKETTEVPGAEIKNVVVDSANWQTEVTFSDNSHLLIPSKGGPLDFIVKRVTLNPSGYNPLAAIVDVLLPTYGRVKVTVHGKDGSEGTITHLCVPLTPSQQVPIFGLYANYANKVDLTFTDSEGNERGTTQITIQTRELGNLNLPRFRVDKALVTQMEPGLNFVNYPGASELDVSIPYMVDNEGEIRWILFWNTSPDLNKFSISSGLKRIKDGSFLAGDQNGQRVVQFDMFGNMLRQWDLKSLGYTFHHDITEAANGNFLITVTKINAKLTNGFPRVMDHIIELDPVNGTVEHEWDLAKIVDTARYLKPDGITPPEYAQNPTNWAHNNSIIEFNGYLAATMRYQGLAAFTSGGALKWIVSPHKYWGAKFTPYLLQPVDESGKLITDDAVINGDASTDGFDWPWGPHTPVALSNNQILLFDNGYNRHWISNRLTQQTNFSRAVIYQINEANKTVQQVWSYGKDRGPDVFSEALSGVQYLPKTGNVLFCPGMGVPTASGFGGRIIEINPATNQVVFEMEITAPSNTAFHRVTRMSVYPDNI